ncbi:MAG: PD40 domain-containing protein [Armatimonadetes bacterium]|nr:PD40 domain-containing protein [Armatimonadota bacterium]
MIRWAAVFLCVGSALAVPKVPIPSSRKLSGRLCAGAFGSATQTPSPSLFSDVPLSHWAYRTVDELEQRGYQTGLPPGSFRSGKPLTRYEFAIAVLAMLREMDRRPLRDKQVESRKLSELREEMGPPRGNSPPEAEARYPSPDGRYVAIVRPRKYEGTTIELRSQEGDRPAMRFRRGYNYACVWSPDGQRLAWLSYRRGKTRPCFVVPGARPIQLEAVPDAPRGTLSWAMNGRALDVWFAERRLLIVLSSGAVAQRE